MILCFFLLNVLERCDSLEAAFRHDHRVETLVELSRCHVARAEYHRSMELLKEHGPLFASDTDRALVMYETGNVYMYGGDIVKAHETFLRLVSSHALLDIANDAAGRLYLIESARDDTVQLRRLINVVRLFETGQYARAADSAKRLLKTAAGPIAYYYLAQSFRGAGDVPQCLSALAELKREYPDHGAHDAALLEADVLAGLGRAKEAREVLEKMIILEPNTIHALRARRKLAEIDSLSEK